MSEMLGQALAGVIGVFRAIVDFCFDTNYPGLVVSFGAVMIGLFMIGLGFDYLDFFTGGSKVRDK